mmetsp:Transcript_6526/g.9286  ORF Transcript_6526/g.9286 Transcript_6526/m.9286 type:complete len:152 (-) Transcript_6526:31-486(-)|eukprot:CAMPEP_0206474898 /NCGR_PEP_ID=MMETSP0324_2-20121206/33760_1 /ASSEMBLY_ACC=CAM_ASM_000836 /TAXON_ID=2866 /ORGANISM="Crypthecodinium cohnii, Strain Seligo" /LENGTH=151 /DNA_ID=CAMNT_0053950157 /DNA_START=185 /DNA_END=640 /DNA_ORIENTATION=-
MADSVKAQRASPFILLAVLALLGSSFVAGDRDAFRRGKAVDANAVSTETLEDSEPLVSSQMEQSSFKESVKELVLSIDKFVRANVQEKEGKARSAEKAFSDSEASLLQGIKGFAGGVNTIRHDAKAEHTKRLGAIGQAIEVAQRDEDQEDD